MLDTLIQWDINLFLFLNSFHSPVWDKIMWFVSDKESWYPLYALIVIYIFRKQKWWGFVPFLFMILLIVIADQSSVHLFKEVFERLRPCHNPDIKDLVHTVNGRCGAKYGFVSSHATNTFAFATFTSFFFRHHTYSALIFFWAIVVSYSRIYLGVHFPGDIIGGAILGFLCAYVLFLIYKFVLKKKSGKLQG